MYRLIYNLPRRRSFPASEMPGEWSAVQGGGKSLLSSTVIVLHIDLLIVCFLGIKYKIFITYLFIIVPMFLFTCAKTLINEQLGLVTGAQVHKIHDNVMQRELYGIVVGFPLSQPGTHLSDSSCFKTTMVYSTVI